MLALSFVLSTLAVAASAAPALQSRQALSDCELTFGQGSLGTYHNFTLGAVNQTLPNANTTGAPLVLGTTHNEGAEQFTALSTYASYPHNDWQTFSLINGTLVPYDNAETWEAAVGLPVSAGQQLGFEISDAGLQDSTSAYCLLSGGNPTGQNLPNPILAVNGDFANFWLCTNNAASEGPSVQNTVVYNASDSAADQGAYDYSTCYRVTLEATQISA